VALRAKKLDVWTTDFVRRHPDAVVLHLGCGLDRRKFFDETDTYRMIGSSVTDPGWLDQIPTEAPTLVVAEGLLMYLTQREVLELLRRLTDRFGIGELRFDTLSPAGPRLSKIFTNGIVKWGTRDAREIEEWDLGLRLVEQVSTLAGYESIPFTPQRLVCRLTYATPMRNYDVLNRFAF
jgi:O-methyltransferase involved in polyketide biosynthesis